MVRGKGFLLNNEMGDFNPQPGVTDRNGRIGTAANIVAPGKRMLSSMCPVIVAKDGRVVMVTGSPGGRTIINTVLCVLLNRLAYDMPPREAVDAPRMSHTWLPDVLSIEAALLEQHGGVMARLEEFGHTVAKPRQIQGDAHSIFVDEAGTVHGVADRRRSGASAGY
jgi:gamma-glutamyltranspeptidase/glutathione hydrolase